MKENIDNWALSKIKTFALLKGMIKKMKRQGTNWEESFINYYLLIKDSYPDYINNSYNSRTRRQSNLKINDQKT